MAPLVLCVLALLAAGGLAELQKPAERTSLEHQQRILGLFYHVHEPNNFKEYEEIKHTWDIQKNAELYENATAVEWSVSFLKNDWNLPVNALFSLSEYEHRLELEVYFNLLYSAKTYDTFYKTAVYLRYHLNPYLYVHALSVAIYHRHDTQDVVVPPLYNIFPSFFFNTEIITTAQRINTHGKRWVDYYPSTYIWKDHVVIRTNETTWPYLTKESRLAYFTHDPAVGNTHHSFSLTYPQWLGQKVCHLSKDRRGEAVWWRYKQFVARYYMERLSNGLGEIPDLDWHSVEEGYTSGLSYLNGIPFPSRPDHFHLDSPWIVEKLQEIEEYESRVRDAIDKGFVITETGEHVDIRKPEAIDILGRLIEANVDSPNLRYYKDFISIWTKVLGNSRVHEPSAMYKGVHPKVLPSVLEFHETAPRDPAFFMIMKRVLGLFNHWHEQLPQYTHEELAVPSVTIDKVDVDKFVTYFEYTRINITNMLWMDELESNHGWDKQSVLLERPQLNHKVYTVRVHVKSDTTKHVTVRFFLAPKYDSKGQEIPIHLNSQNFFQLDAFEYHLKEGDNVITRASSDSHWPFASDDMLEGFELAQKVEDVLHGHGQYVFDIKRRPDAPPRRLLLPKGRVGGMPFVLMVYISEYHAPNTAFGTGFDPAVSFGLGSGARRFTSDPLGFPVDRPLHEWQIANVKNIWFEDVSIHHKESPEVEVPQGH